VFVTDSILTTIMCAAKSLYSWDIVVTKVGDKLFFDKREGSTLDLLTVNETAPEQVGYALIVVVLGRGVAWVVVLTKVEGVCAQMHGPGFSHVATQQSEWALHWAGGEGGLAHCQRDGGWL
jgi:hypothetical protein